jgi:mono/diheme cytochrome c family protein
MTRSTRPGRLAAAVSSIFAAAVIAAALAASAPPLHPPEPHRQTEGQVLENPVPATADSVATGRQWYVFMCRECHGNTGLGDGDMAHAGGVPSDFTDDVWDHGESDGEIFAVIKEGVSADMQGYANRLSDEEIWHVVNYLRSLYR